jgi:hypothetical protein
MSVAARFADTKALSGCTALEAARADGPRRRGARRARQGRHRRRPHLRRCRPHGRARAARRASQGARGAHRGQRGERAADRQQGQEDQPAHEECLRALGRAHGGLVDELSTCSLAASECLTRVFQVAQAAPRWPSSKTTTRCTSTELAARIINDVNLLVQRVAAIQGFTYENFLPVRRQRRDAGARGAIDDRRRTS